MIYVRGFSNLIYKTYAVQVRVTNKDLPKSIMGSPVILQGMISDIELEVTVSPSGIYQDTSKFVY